MKNSVDKKITSILVILMAFISSISVDILNINGITFIKLLTALFFTPIILTLYLNNNGLTQKVPSDLLFLLVIITIVFLLDKNKFHSLLGEDGRNNGLLSLIVFVVFAFGGVLIQQSKNEIFFYWFLLLNGFWISVVYLLFLNFPHLRLNNFLDQYNLFGPFHDNANPIMILLIVALISAILITRLNIVKKLNFLIAVLSLPPVFTLWKLDSMQGLVIIPLVMLSIYFLSYNVRYFPFYILFTIVILIIISLIFVKMNIRIDSSIEERKNMLSIGIQSIKDRIFVLPETDFVANHHLFLNGMYINDFHNFVLQYLYTFGVFIGFFLIFIFTKPLFRYRFIDSNNAQNFLNVVLYFTFFLSFYFNFLSLTFLIYAGISFGTTLNVNKNQKRRFMLNKYLFNTIIFGLFYLYSIGGFFVSFQEYRIEKEISKLVSTLSNPVSRNQSNMDELLRLTLRSKSSKVNFLVAYNFLNVGDCFRADKIISYMHNLNSKEIRLKDLNSLERVCITS